MMTIETSRRDFLKTLGLGMAGATMVGWDYGKAFADEKRPNFIFILTDDQRWDTLGCMGNGVVQSPNIDRLAAQGVLFENCFVTTPVCGPSRACILSGQYARRHGVTDIGKLMNPGPWELTYPALLKKHGYSNGYIGKFNVGAADDVALWGSRYDYWAGWKYHGNYWHERNCPSVTNDGIREKTKNICTCPPEGEMPRVGHTGMKDPMHTTTEMVPIKVGQFLDGRDRNAPFCLAIGMKAPKDPWDDFPPELAALYEGVKMPIPVTATPEMAASIPEILRKSLGSDTGLRYVNNHEELATRI
ncbi:MAG: sulfatase-like hydrolase/transferase, partial [Deltaproteobacteria bacterium]